MRVLRALLTRAKLFVRWLWSQLKDWRTALTFGVVCVVLSAEVWVPYLIALVTHNSWWAAVGSACWLFWLGPGTPFVALALGIAVAIRRLHNIVHRRRDDNEHS